MSALKINSSFFPKVRNLPSLEKTLISLFVFLKHVFENVRRSLFAFLKHVFENVRRKKSFLYKLIFYTLRKKCCPVSGVTESKPGQGCFQDFRADTLVCRGVARTSQTSKLVRLATIANSF